jgi:peptidoglycan biosynthesis protein MviN/MurJ (putative lipid II flippase)
MSFFKVESYKAGIVLSTSFNIFNKGLVFLNGLLVAYYFGINQSTDLFFYVYNAVLIVGVYITSLNNSVIIPESMRLRAQSGEKDSMSFLNFFLILYLLFILLVLFLFFLNPISSFSIISNFSVVSLRQNTQLILLSLPLFAMIGIISLFVDILASYKFFTLSMIVGIVNSLFSISFMIFFRNSLGIRSVFYGLIISYSCNIAILLCLLRRYLHWQFGLVNPKIGKRIWANIGFAQLGNVTSTLSSYLPIYILSGFNVGVITALTFAQQIASLPNALIINQFSSVVGIKFNELYSAKQYVALDKVFRETASFLLFIMFPASFFIYFFSEEIVNFLLGFASIKKSAAEYVTLFLKLLGFLLPLYVVNILISRLFMASHKIKESFWYQILFNLVLMSAMFYYVHNFGIIGYPLTVVGAYFLNVWICYFLGRRYFGFIKYKKVLKEFILLGFVNLGLSSGLFLLMKITAIKNPIFLLTVAGILNIILLLLVNKALNINKLISTVIEKSMKKIFNYEFSRFLS